ncbi:MAG: endonuclease domain-containing protein [Bacteroidales bacterium]|nr:endonuclease domain-containing protein [Bacteroidales bacterium]
MKWPEIKKIASRLRNNPTYSESRLWHEIRKNKLLGRKFLRQHPILYDANRMQNEYFFFIPDFYCASEKLVIELDGRIHDFQKDKDYRRDLILNHLDIKVLRFKNDELNDIEKVISTIMSSFGTVDDKKGYPKSEISTIKHILEQ